MYKEDKVPLSTDDTKTQDDLKRGASQQVSAFHGQWNIIK
jgi:hypothetical protein